MFGPLIPPTHFWDTTDIPLYLSREISIEHPSVGLASLAQLQTNVRSLAACAHAHYTEGITSIQRGYYRDARFVIRSHNSNVCVRKN